MSGGVTSQPLAAVRCRGAVTQCTAPVSPSLRPLLRHKAVVHAPLRKRQTPAAPRAEKSSSGGGKGSGGAFWGGFLLGGAIFGALGFYYAPQISKAILGEDDKLKFPKFLEDEGETLEATRQNLTEKIAQLNTVIDDVSAKLDATDGDGKTVKAADGTYSSVPSESGSNRNASEL